MNEVILSGGKNFAVKKKLFDYNRPRDDLNLANVDLHLPGLSTAFTF
jgi:hypothetical protein